jgi:hypothetical protein
VQPVHFQGTIADTWKPVLERLQRLSPGEALIVDPELPAELPGISQAALHA